MHARDYIEMDATAIAEAVASGAADPAAVARVAVALAAAADARLNIFSERLAPPDLRDAAAGRLSGVPVAVKDFNGPVDGLICTNGSRLFETARVAAPTHLGRAILDEGCVPVGVTMAPEFSMQAHSHNAVFGEALNPWDTAATPGGSSGGSAAAVAARVVPLAQASDIAGSIRVPAAWCGVVGLKPSRGRVSAGPRKDESGLGLASNMMLCRSMRDCAVSLDMVARTFAGDPPRPAAPMGGYGAPEAGALPGGLRIAVSTAGSLGHPVAGAVRAAVDHTAGLLDRMGHRIVDTAPVLLDRPVLAALADVWMAQHAQFLGTTRQLTRASDLSALGQVARIGFVHGCALTATGLIDALDVLNAYRRAAATAAQDFDILLTPTAATAAPSCETMQAAAMPDDMTALLDGTFAPFFQHTIAGNVTGQPAISLPLGRDGAGRPIGVQLTAAWGREDLLLALGRGLEQAAPWAGHMPPMVAEMI
ncbi:MAG: amidase [Rhodobacteraceae bacterium]|nr:amidase [Paracoccaceae bacterium]